jgi:ketosteroid isomerase-like protein
VATAFSVALRSWILAAMPRENVEVVRRPIRASQRSRRTLDQRLGIRFPRLAAANFRLLGRLPPRSRIRQAILARGIRLAAEAYNRRDMDAVVINYHPEIEYLPAQSWVEAGFFEPCYRGRDGYRRYVATTADVFGGDVRFEPFEVVDAGDTVVMLANVPMRAQASGVPLTEKFAYVATQKHGMVIRLQEYYDHAEALEAAGVGPAS